MKIPAHKNITNPPGQIVNRPDQTLGDYINRRYRHEAFEQVKQEKKLSFNEWWNSVGVWSYGNYMEQQQAEGIWNAAQENM